MARRWEETTNQRDARGNPEGWATQTPQGADFGAGRSIPQGTPTIHQQRTHPTYVEGCFACRISTVGVSLPPHASTRGDGIRQASDLKREHEALVKAHPGRYARVSKSGRIVG